MKKILIVLAAVTFVFAACNKFGEKYQPNDKSEVYYKGDGVTADDAKRLGDFLLKNNYFDTISEKSVQLTKTVDTFNIRFVVDEQKVNEAPNAEMLFTIMGAAISADVFGNKPVKVILADAQMKAFKEIPPYIPAAEPADTTAAPADTTSVQ